MTQHVTDSARYWDTNLDPANLGTDHPDTTRALQRELEFAQDTPDIQQMLNWVCPLPSPSIARDTAMSSPLSTSSKILDIGTGLGTAAVLLRDRGATVIALDISHRRLAAMRSAAESLHGNATHQPARIFPVKARAEALPFRKNALDGACSRAVLIHTDIPRVCEEVARTLKPGTPVAFSEVMASNPLVKIYRRILAPREWQAITTYFTDAEIGTVKRLFANPQENRFYELGFLAFLFQYALPWRRGFRIALKCLKSIDTLICRTWPRFRRYAWFVLITGKTRQP